MAFAPLESITQANLSRGDYILVRETDARGGSRLYPAIYGGVEVLTLPGQLPRSLMQFVTPDLPREFTVVRVFDALVCGKYCMKGSEDNILWGNDEFERSKKGAMLPLHPVMQKILFEQHFSVAYEYECLRKA
jgi:hypothetical protein